MKDEDVARIQALIVQAFSSRQNGYPGNSGMLNEQEQDVIVEIGKIMERSFREGEADANRSDQENS